MTRRERKTHISPGAIWGVSHTGHHNEQRDGRCVHRALRNTRSTIDAVIRVDVELLLVAVEALTRTHHHAIRVLAAHTGAVTTHAIAPPRRLKFVKPRGGLHAACRAKCPGNAADRSRSDDAIWSDGEMRSRPVGVALETVLAHLAVERRGFQSEPLCSATGTVHAPVRRAQCGENADLLLFRPCAGGFTRRHPPTTRDRPRVRRRYTQSPPVRSRSEVRARFRPVV